MDVDGTVDIGVIWQICDIKKGPHTKMKDMNMGFYGCQTQTIQGNAEKGQMCSPLSQ